MAIVPGLVTVWQFVVFAFEVSPETQTKLRYFGLSRRSFWEVFCGLVALSIIIVSVEGAFRAVRKREAEMLAMRKTLDGRERRKMVREQLGRFLEARDAFNCAPGFSLGQTEGKALKQLDLEIRAFLSKEPLDDSYVARFNADPLSALKDFIKELTDKTEPQI